MKTEWLLELCTSGDPRDICLKELESLGLSDDNRSKLLNQDEQFRGWVTTMWNPFIIEKCPGDELWRFRSPPSTWENMAGCAGYSIVRCGAIVCSLVTLRN
jgi:hypothetical protein